MGQCIGNYNPQIRQLLCEIVLTDPQSLDCRNPSPFQEIRNRFFAVGVDQIWWNALESMQGCGDEARIQLGEGLELLVKRVPKESSLFLVTVGGGGSFPCAIARLEELMS